MSQNASENSEGYLDTKFEHVIVFEQLPKTFPAQSPQNVVSKTSLWFVKWPSYVAEIKLKIEEFISGDNYYLLDSLSHCKLILFQTERKAFPTSLDRAFCFECLVECYLEENRKHEYAAEYPTPWHILLLLLY